MCWSAPLSDSVTIDPRTAPEACASMAEVRLGVDALDRALVQLLAERQRYMDAAARIKPDRSVVLIAASQAEAGRSQHLRSKRAPTRCDCRSSSGTDMQTWYRSRRWLH